VKGQEEKAAQKFKGVRREKQEINDLSLESWMGSAGAARPRISQPPASQ
jgi:hypothetical protein